MNCGEGMIHHHGAKDRPWAYYVCRAIDTRPGLEKPCNSRRVNARRAEQAILSTVLDRILTPAFLEELMEEARGQIFDASDIEREITQKQTLLEGLDRSIQRLLDLVENGNVDTGDAIARLKQRQAERARIQSEMRLSKARCEAAKLEITPEALAKVLDTWRGQLTDLIQSEDILAQRALLARFITKVELGYERGRIWYTYPVDGSTSRNKGADLGALVPYALFVPYDMPFI
jgi:hypothetical protein